MGTFVVKSSTLNSQYEYKDANPFVNGNYSKDATTDTLRNVSGSCYRITPDGGQGDYVGNFNGYMRELCPDMQTGVFQADMKVGLINDGPFTLWLDSKEVVK